MRSTKQCLLIWIFTGTILLMVLIFNFQTKVTMMPCPDSINKTDSKPFFAIWCGKICWESYVSDQFYHIFKDLEDSYGWKEVLVSDMLGRIWFRNDTLETYFTRYFQRIPDVLLYIECYETVVMHSQLPDWKSIQHTWLFMNDVHAFDAKTLRTKKAALLAVKNIISPYPYKFDNEYASENETGLNQWSTFHRTWLPHSASPSFLVAYNRTPKKKILLSGAISSAYPYRSMLFEMITKTTASKLKNFVDYHKHPGYDPVKNETQSGARGGYGPLINRYFAAITDTLTKNYIVAKIFEIPAAGTLLLLNTEAIPILERLGWFADIHYVAYNKTNMENILLEVLSEKSSDKYENIRWTGHQAALAFHTTKRRALFLHNLAIANFFYG